MPQTLLNRVVYPIIAGIAVFGLEILLRSHGGSAGEVASEPKTAIAPVVVAAGGAAVGPHHVLAAIVGAKPLLIGLLVAAVVCAMMLVTLVIVLLPIGM